MRKVAVACLALVALAALVAIGGCGGTDGQVPPGPNPGPAATFVGKDVCIVCHAGPGGSYVRSSPHGQDFYTAHGMDLIDGRGGVCAPCHVTGFQETGGWKSTAETPHLAGISCEECHGPGSEHGGAPGSSNIVLEPNAATTCWDCHVNEYKKLRSEPEVVTDADLASTKPASVHVYHSQAAFLNGYLGFNRPQMKPAHALIENTCVFCHLGPGRHHGASGLDIDYDQCVSCHRTADRAKQKVEEREEETEQALIEIGGEDPSNPGEVDESGAGGLMGAFVAAHGIDVNSTANSNNEFVKRYKAAKWNFSYIISSAAGGSHNPGFTDQLLEDTKALLQ